MGIAQSIAATFDDAVYYIFGYTDTWAFMDNEHLPVQVRYIRPDELSEVDMFYRSSMNLWFTDYIHIVNTYIPWITATLEIAGKVYDLSEFMMHQKVKVDIRRPVYPSADQLVAAWSLRVGRWFSFADRCNAVLRVMNGDCEEFELGLVLNSDEEVDTYGLSLGVKKYSQCLDFAAAAEEGGESGVDADDDTEEEEEDDAGTVSDAESVDAEEAAADAAADDADAADADADTDALSDTSATGAVGSATDAELSDAVTETSTERAEESAVITDSGVIIATVPVVELTASDLEKMD
jgi:hypothetical protein